MLSIDDESPANKPKGANHVFPTAASHSRPAAANGRSHAVSAVSAGTAALTPTAAGL